MSHPQLWPQPIDLPVLPMNRGEKATVTRLDAEVSLAERFITCILFFTGLRRGSMLKPAIDGKNTSMSHLSTATIHLDQKSA